MAVIPYYWGNITTRPSNYVMSTWPEAPARPASYSLTITPAMPPNASAIPPFWTTILTLDNVFNLTPRVPAGRVKCTSTARWPARVNVCVEKVTFTGLWMANATRPSLRVLAVRANFWSHMNKMRLWANVWSTLVHGLTCTLSLVLTPKWSVIRYVIRMTWQLTLKRFWDQSFTRFYFQGWQSRSVSTWSIGCLWKVLGEIISRWMWMQSRI